MSKLRLMLLAAGLIAACSGCGNSLPATVSGSVTIGGDAPTGNVAGEVMFHPAAGGAMAMAPLNDDGTFTISTGTTKGLEPGSYNVTVRVVETEPPPPGGYQNAPGQKPLSHAKYSDKNTSGLTAEVKPGKNEFDFDLESK